MKAFLLTFPILSLKSLNSCIAASELHRKCRKKSLTIKSTIGLLIAQFALEHCAILLHVDRDFDATVRVCDLKVKVSNHD